MTTYTSPICSNAEGDAELQLGDSLISQNGQYSLTLEDDGVLVWTDNNTGAEVPISPNPPGNPIGIVLVLLEDGVLELQDGGGIIRWVGPSGLLAHGCCLWVQNNGEIQIIAKGGGVVWTWNPPASAMMLLGALQKAQADVEATQANMEAIRQDVESAKQSLFKLLARRIYPHSAPQSSGSRYVLPPPSVQRDASRGKRRNSNIEEIRPGEKIAKDTEKTG